MHERDQERELLIRDKYNGDRATDLSKDLERLSKGEPLAYAIGWIPFCGVRIELDSRPLIPRPETEWWTLALIEHLKERFGEKPFTLLDLCAGSGAIGISVLQSIPNARVLFAELDPKHVEQIQKNLSVNGIDVTRAAFYTGDLFATLPNDLLVDVIATNPPYVPRGRELERSVTGFEPSLALFAESDGLALIRRIAAEAAGRLLPSGELWMECDIDNIEEAQSLVIEGGAREATIRTDLYGRPRVVVGYYS